MDFRTRLEQSRTKGSEPELGKEIDEPVDFPYFGIDSVRSIPACIDLRLPLGKHKALPYSYFTEIDYDNETGIEILTNTKKITIVGRDLSRLYDYLVNYRVRFIRTHVGGDPQEDGVFVQEIRVEDTE